MLTYLPPNLTTYSLSLKPYKPSADFHMSTCTHTLNKLTGGKEGRETDRQALPAVAHVS